MKYKLGDILSSISNKFDSDKDKAIFLNTSDIKSGKLLTKKYQNISKLPGQAKKSIKKDDILYSEIRPKNKRYALVNIDDTNDYVVSTKLMVLRNIRPDIVDTKYIYYFLTSNRIIEYLQSEAESRSGTFPQITYDKNISNIFIDIPSIKEQIKIVGILDSLSNKIEINDKINANLYDIAKTEFSNFFPDVNNGESNIGDLIINFDKNRKPISKNKRSLIPGKYRYIGATSINDYINKYNFDGIYLLLGEDGSVQDENGFPILQYTFGKFWPNNHTHVLKGKIVSTEWLYLFFSQRNIESIVTGAVQKKISQKNLNSLSVKTPTNNEIISFEKTIQPMFKKIRNNYNENLSLKKIKNELLSKLLN